jgi:signal transduction histidine kinase
MNLEPIQSVEQLPCDQRLEQEVATYIAAVQAMQSKLAEQEQLVEIGEFTTQIVHEIRNPLTTLEMGLQYAKKMLPAEADQQRLTLALNESHRLKHLLTEILLYAKPQTLKLVKLNLIEFLTELFTQLRETPDAIDRQIELTYSQSDLDVLADPDKLKQVFINLVQNALEAIAPGETVSSEIVNHSGEVYVNIHNGGVPIPADLLPQLPTPFCSTKPSGTGLGLAIAKRIVTAHGGDLTIQSSTLRTTVSVRLIQSQ